MGQVMRIRYRGVPTQKQDAPFAEMNITPLIDVMLVLLIMFIMVIPVAMHKTVVDMPTGTGTVARDPQVQNIYITKDGNLLWNGDAVSRAELAGKLKLSAAADDTLKMQTDAGARYDEFAQVIAIVKRANIKKIGFVGNNQYRDFSK